MRSLPILAAAFLCALALPAAHAQCANGTAIASSTAAPGWWPNVSSRPASGFVEVNGAAKIPLQVIAPTKAQVVAGIAPDARAFCFPLAKLRDGDQLVIVTESAGGVTRSTPCRFLHGDLHSFRWYGTPRQKLATVNPRIVPIDATTGTCAPQAVVS